MFSKFQFVILLISLINFSDSHFINKKKYNVDEQAINLKINIYTNDINETRISDSMEEFGVKDNICNHFNETLLIHFPEQCICYSSKDDCFTKFMNSSDFLNYNWTKLTNIGNVSDCILKHQFRENTCIQCDGYQIKYDSHIDNGECLYLSLLGILIIVGSTLICFFMILLVYRRITYRSRNTYSNLENGKRRYILFTK
jgi:hypothetical protein